VVEACLASSRPWGRGEGRREKEEEWEGRDNQKLPPWKYLFPCEDGVLGM
jgi:hypothetical protein